MRLCSRSGCRRRWGSWSGQRGKGCWRCRWRSGSGCSGELLEQEVDEVVGLKGKWNRERTAVRDGHEDGEVTLGGRRVGVARPRVRAADGESEVALRTDDHFADRDQLQDVVSERMLAGVLTRKYRRAQEPVGERVTADARSTSKSAVSRALVGRTRDLLWTLINRPLADLRLAVIMLDGIALQGRTNIVALGLTAEGDKLALGRWDGSTENATVTAALLADLVDRGLDVEQGLLCVIDGSKGLRKGDTAGVRQRCRGRALRLSTRSATCSTISPNATATRSRPGGIGRARTPTTTTRTSSSTTWRASSTRPPRRRRLAARGDARDAHRHPARDHRQAQADAAVDQPDRVDDLHRPRHQPQRQALDLERDVPAVDRRRRCSKPKPGPAKSRATAASPTTPSRSNTTSPGAATAPSTSTPPPSLCNHDTRARRHQSSTTTGATSRAGLRLVAVALVSRRRVPRRKRSSDRAV